MNLRSVLATCAVALLFGACGTSGGNTSDGGGGAAPSGGGGAEGTTSSTGGTGGSGGEASGDLKAISQSCDSDAQCSSGHCPSEEGVCCDSACAAPCMACLGELTGKLNGQCAPVTAMSDPHDDCPNDDVCLPGAGCCDDEVEPPGGPCPAECTSCDAGTCLIECLGPEACREKAIVCPEGFSCQLSCSGFRACQKTTLACPATYACHVECSDDQDSCRDIDVDCGTGVCSMTCGGDDSCNDARLQCGPDACRASCLVPTNQIPDLDNCQDACLCEPCAEN